MKNWATLALATVRAEFPHFEILQTFHIFHIPASPVGCINADLRESMQAKQREHCMAMASCLNMDGNALLAQLQDHASLAQTIYVSTKTDTLGAWREALHLTQRSPKLEVRAKHPCAELQRALIRYGAWGGSTGGVERSFAVGKNINGISGRGCNMGLYEDELQINANKSEALVPKVCERAQSIWGKYYGECRVSKRLPRVDTGSESKRKMGVNPSLLGWVKRRRQEVTDLQHKFPKVPIQDRSTNPKVGLGWSEGHQKEFDFQSRKRALRFIDAVMEGTVQPSTLSGDMSALIAHYVKMQEAVEAKHKNEHVKRAAALAKPAVPLENAKKIFVAKGVDVGNAQTWARLLRAMRVQQTNDRMLADVFVLDEPAKPGQRIIWCAMLGGRTLCTVDFVRTNGERGTAITYKKAVASRRQVWVSDNFKRSHVECFAILASMVKLKGSHWRWLRDRDAFVALAKLRTSKGHGGEVVGFVTRGDRANEDRRHVVP